VKRFLKVLLILVAVGVFFVVLLPGMMSYHDSITQRTLLRTVARELSRNASMAEMTEFMQRHTVRFAVNQDDQLEYAGFVHQSELDRFLGDRKVQIILELNRNSKTFQRAAVRIYYTGP